MDKRELRIDNWVLSNNAKPFQVYAETFNDIEAGYLIPVPIPLTDEILKECGFEKIEKDYSDHFKMKNILIEHLHIGGVFMVRLIWDEEHSLFITELEYLHQLQNLLFAISQTELQINL